MDRYKYLGVPVHLNSRLDWSTNSDAVYKKGLSRPFFSCGSSDYLLCAVRCQKSTICLCFKVSCCGPLGEGHQNQGCKGAVSKAGLIIGQNLETFESIRDMMTLTNLLSIMDYLAHPLPDILQRHQSLIISAATGNHSCYKVVFSILFYSILFCSVLFYSNTLKA